MLCPIYKSALLKNGGDKITNGAADCDQEFCALWHKEKKRCSLQAIGVLHSLAEKAMRFLP
jgi:hypothetical protein